MTERKTEFYVGVFVLLGIIALIFLALRAGNMTSFSLFQKTYHIAAKFDNVGTLKTNAAVKSNGVVVGRVKAIHFDNQDFKAIVDISIDEPYVFPQDSSLSINTAGLLGDQYVSITPGADEQNWTDGAYVQFTQGAIVLEDLISKFLFSSAEKQGSK
ncbi:outer membrane lipid asymmetry maintenance protein MlaD [Basilea psittacipulmonis]|uniref:ABC transporter substrate-binding protein n=1 Tax=Basilea psittacipulmonis DSM 24701 TaxID=1072685 RepID=A0A077DEY5_9BURK|nr:outer membrane lipid asymmetry maintenance protein MlaD [Basilea psittacipulmonis]AIL33329.1 ABC transporter substrate-binding protein [Basilea psittacipulmonis DSM 24701]